MAVNIHSLVAAISPDIYCDPMLKGSVKKIAKEKGFLAAAKEAKLRPQDYMDSDLVDIEGPIKLHGIKNPIEKHKLVYDSFSQALEPIYFWILDYINGRYGKSEKLIDNFMTSPGSSQFGEMGSRATRMQEEAMKMLGTAGAIVKSILNIVYDLKEFKIRLNNYDDLKSKDKARKSAALLSLKQVWLDQVDFAKRGTTSLKQMAAQFDYVTIIDAFMVANSLEHVKKLDLNDRVKRILEQRVLEFQNWIKESEQELRKRFEIEKIYLKNQVNSVKLYARWIKPYLKAAQQLEQRGSESAALVSSFNTTLLELTILGRRKIDIDLEIKRDNFPKSFKKLNFKNYQPMIIVEFKYRAAPERISQGAQSGYGYRGSVEIEFTSYALTDPELAVLRAELEKDDLGDLMKMIEGSTTDSLDKIQVDLDEFLGPDSDKGNKKKGEESLFSSFSSLFKTESSKVKQSKKGLTKDTDSETLIRNQAIIDARMRCRGIYNAYKGSNQMPSFTN
jgi:hypothetical protein